MSTSEPDSIIGIVITSSDELDAILDLSVVRVILIELPGLVLELPISIIPPPLIIMFASPLLILPSLLRSIASLFDVEL